MAIHLHLSLEAQAPSSPKNSIPRCTWDSTHWVETQYESPTEGKRIEKKEINIYNALNKDYTKKRVLAVAAWTWSFLDLHI